MGAVNPGGGSAPGTYCDIVNGDMTSTGASCTGASIKVAPDGSAHFEIAPMQAVAVHVGAKLGGS